MDNTKFQLFLPLGWEITRLDITVKLQKKQFKLVNTLTGVYFSRGT